MSENSNSKSSNGGCNCGGCLSALVIGTAIVGTIALGGCSKAWHKLKSSWDYDNQLQVVQRVMDENRNGVLEVEEERRMYQRVGLPLIEGEVPRVKIPYENLLNFSDGYKQEF